MGNLDFEKFLKNSIWFIINEWSIFRNLKSYYKNIIIRLKSTN